MASVKPKNTNKTSNNNKNNTFSNNMMRILWIGVLFTVTLLGRPSAAASVALEAVRRRDQVGVVEPSQQKHQLPQPQEDHAPAIRSSSLPPPPSPQQRRREQQFEGRVLECIPAGIVGFQSCATFCNETTGSALNTFIVLDGPLAWVNGTDKDLQFCCACFSGYAYCTDDIPECADYVDLDDGTFEAIEFVNETDTGHQVEGGDDDDNVDDNYIESLEEASSCLDDFNITVSAECGAYCANETGDASHSFGSQPAMGEYYCICSTLSEGATLFCSDNMDDGWDEFFNITSANATMKESPSKTIEESLRVRFFGSEVPDMETCREEGVLDWLTCEQYCMQSTGHALNTFSTVTGPSGDPNHCCACYHGNSFCSDNIPSCQDYANLVALEDFLDSDQDDGDVVADGWFSGQKEDSLSCLVSDITSSPACGDFCTLRTGSGNHVFGSIEDNDQYYCVCHKKDLVSTERSSNGAVQRPRSSSSTDSQRRVYCSDNMMAGWQDYFFNNGIHSSQTSDVNDVLEVNSSTSSSPVQHPFLPLRTTMVLCLSLYFSNVLILS